jgi:glycosyltransferase 2 family protein
MGICRGDSFAGVVIVLEATIPPARPIMRSIGRNRISIAISLLIVAVAAGTLYHLLRGIEFARVFAAIAAQPWHRILIAAALVFAGYFNLIFYDLFALRTIDKRRIPFRVAALASFTSYTIGHSLGAATLTCGLVRFRVYSFWDLNVVDIAKIAFLTGMTYWLGNIFVLGGAVAYAPAVLSAIDHLPDWLNRSFGLAGLCALACYLLWLLPGPRIVGRANWRIVLPSPRGTLLQIGIGSLDRCLAALSFYMLLPDRPVVGIATVLIIFVMATLVGTISHAPGSLGVVEAAMLVGLPQFQREELLATLLIFRVLDFFLPLFLATALFGLRELRLLVRRAHSRRADTAACLVRTTPPR